MKVKSADMYYDSGTTVYGQFDNGKYFMGDPYEQNWYIYDKNPKFLLTTTNEKRASNFINEHCVGGVLGNEVVKFEEEVARKLSPFKSRQLKGFTDIYFRDTETGVWDWEFIRKLRENPNKIGDYVPIKQPKVNNSRLQRMSRGI